MRLTRMLAAVFVLVAAACGGTDSGVRTVLVDFSSDEFASFALFNFPPKVAVRQGDTLRFKQTWTGEPHTVTGGLLVDEQLKAGTKWITFFEAFEELAASGAALPNPDSPDDATVADLAAAVNQAESAEAREKFLSAYDALREQGVPLPDLANPPAQPFSDVVALVDTEAEKAFSALPGAFTEEDELAQNVSQPCFRREGGPPEGPQEACPDADQRQPAFDGRHSYYNSGVIPYEGVGGNSFSVRIADDAEPGTYLFYCAIHGFGQRSEIEIRKAGSEIPSEGAVARQARKETKKVSEALGKVFRDATDDQRISVPGPEGEEVEIEGPFAGLPGEEHSAINEFVPKRITVKAGEPITWKMMGARHTISFNVPRYFPIMEFLDDGTVRINPRLDAVAGGARALPDQETQGPVRHDGGEFAGDGFWSSGLIGAEPYLEYTMRITKPGTYSYACLIHPPMVGTLKVT